MGITGAILSTKKVKIPQANIPSNILSKVASNEL
jgi:hypothetical protein